jgi:hypothetical protein
VNSLVISPNEPATKVFISYTHEAERSHGDAVLALSNKLRTESGFDCEIDQYHSNENWPLWMEKSIRDAKYVLVVCNATYLRRWNQEEKPGKGLGAKWESMLTRNHLYSQEGRNDKFIPVVLRPEDRSSIPTPLADVTRIDYYLDDGFARLCSRLNNIPSAEKPPVRRSLAPIALAANFFSLEEGSLQQKYDNTDFGIINEVERLWSNMMPIEFASSIRRYKLRRFKNISPIERIRGIWKDSLKLKNDPTTSFLLDYGTAYQFDEGEEDETWRQMVSKGYAERLDSLKSTQLADSSMFSDRTLFSKLLNRRLESHCDKSYGADNGVLRLVRVGKPLNCYLFPAIGNKMSKLKAQALSKAGTRVVVQPIYSSKNGEVGTIQHWKHVAFRHNFMRFGMQWHLVLNPIWAFTKDGHKQVSSFHRISARNMKKPERNRAVLGHVAFWASILCNPSDDMFYKNDSFRILSPIKMAATPSIRDKDWIRIDSSEEKALLDSDLQLNLDL